MVNGVHHKNAKFYNRNKQIESLLRIKENLNQTHYITNPEKYLMHPDRYHIMYNNITTF